MKRRQTRYTRTDTHIPDTTLVRASRPVIEPARRAGLTAVSHGQSRAGRAAPMHDTDERYIKAVGNRDAPHPEASKAESPSRVCLVRFRWKPISGACAP